MYSGHLTICFFIVSQTLPLVTIRDNLSPVVIVTYLLSRLWGAGTYPMCHWEISSVYTGQVINTSVFLSLMFSGTKCWGDTNIQTHKHWLKCKFMVVWLFSVQCTHLGRLSTSTCRPHEGSVLYYFNVAQCQCGSMPISQSVGGYIYMEWSY